MTATLQTKPPHFAHFIPGAPAASGWFDGKECETRRQALLGLVVVAVLAGALLFPRLNYPLVEPDEGRFAQISLSMMQRGDYLTPMLNGKPYNHKPPLAYALVALSYQVFGVHEWSMRLVPALSSWLVVLLVYAWGRRALGNRSALLSALVLTTMLGFGALGRMMLLDSLLTLFVLLAVCTGHLAGRGLLHSRTLWLFSAVCCGLGVLTKGPVALVLTLPPLLMFGWLDRKCCGLRWTGWLLWLCVAAVVALPWYTWTACHNPSFLHEFLWQHNVQRFANPMADHHHEPWWFYAPVLLVELMPWTFVFGFAVFSWRTRLHQNRQPIPGMLLACVFSAMWMVLFFSVSRGKLPTYLMPALPLLAFPIGHYIEWLLFADESAAEASTWHRWMRHGGPLLAITLLLLAVTGDALVDICHDDDVPFHIGEVAVITIVLAALWWNRSCLHARGAWLCCYMAFYGFFLWAYWYEVPGWAAIRDGGQPGRDFVVMAKSEGLPVVAYSGNWDAAGYYLYGETVAVFPTPFSRAELHAFLDAHPRCLILVRAKTEQFNELRQKLEPEFHVERTMQLGRVIGVVVKRTAMH